MERLGIWAVPVGGFIELRVAKSAPEKRVTSIVKRFKTDYGDGTYQVTFKNVAYLGGKNLLTLSAAKFRVLLRDLGIEPQSLTNAYQLPTSAAAMVKDAAFRRQYQN